MLDNVARQLLLQRRLRVWARLTVPTMLARAGRRPARALLTAPRRFLASELAPAKADGSVPSSSGMTKPSVSVSTATAVPASSVPAAVYTPRSSGPGPVSAFVSRLLSFSVGVGVGAAVVLYTLREDISASARDIDASVQAMRTDVGKANEELRRRIARLEAQVSQSRS